MRTTRWMLPVKMPRYNNRATQKPRDEESSSGFEAQPERHSVDWTRQQVGDGESQAERIYVTSLAAKAATKQVMANVGSDD